MVSLHITNILIFVFSDEGTRKELIHMIDAVTTNKTDFFREADHFDILLNVICGEGPFKENRAFYDMVCRVLDRRRAVYYCNGCRRIPKNQSFVLFFFICK